MDQGWGSWSKIVRAGPQWPLQSVGLCLAFWLMLFVCLFSCYFCFCVFLLTYLLATSCSFLWGRLWNNEGTEGPYITTLHLQMPRTAMASPLHLTLLSPLLPSPSSFSLLSSLSSLLPSLSSFLPPLCYYKGWVSPIDNS